MSGRLPVCSTRSKRLEDFSLWQRGKEVRVLERGYETTFAFELACRGGTSTIASTAMAGVHRLFERREHRGHR